MNNEIVLKPSHWASVSGGKDSLYMLNLILHNLDKYPLDGVVHFELEIDFPFIKNVIDYMEDECKKHGITFIRIKPRTTWKELYNKYGFPTRIARWCNSRYKLDAKRQCEEFLKSQGCYLVSYIGYCADEIKRFENRAGNKEIYPLVDAGINECEILEWAKEVPIFNDYYKFNKRCGCMYCPMISMPTLAYMLKYYPDNYNELMKFAKETELLRERELGRPFSVFDRPKYNSDYKNKRVHEVYLPKLEEQIRNNEEKKMSKITTEMLPITNTKLKSCVNAISVEMGRVKKSTVAIAKRVWEIKTNELYKDDYESFNECMEVTLNMDKTLASRMFNAYDRLQNNGVLQDFEIGQITEMLPLEDKEICEAVSEEIITPEMTQKELRNTVKKIKANRDTEDAEEVDADELAPDTNTEVAENGEEVITGDKFTLAVMKNCVSQEIEISENDYKALVKKYFK